MNKQRALRYAAIFLLGIIVGSIVVLFLFARNLEKQMITNRNLKLVNERQLEEIAGLKKSQNVEKKRQDDRIEEIRVTILDPKPDEIMTAELIRRLEKDMAPLKGKKAGQVAEFQPMLHEFLKKREYAIEGKKAEVQLKTVVISRVLHLFVNVRAQSSSSLVQ